ncbi:putative alpha-N-acetylglucosaminidase [Penicillium oxalicum 114-2]|uniref:Putative alpha-N-acetylglucosaminidase n=1 Tax=Penicillium oxalicum (strain 114-2 / CGMCC 5302) TaxID=933388 RepID=S8AYV0_PENO1|nr:putative alpha-N-acetylglucosaminidase [Penicillium oxalicum 114-2]
MHLQTIAVIVWLLAAASYAQSTTGLYGLLRRRLPNHVDRFRFTVDATCCSETQGYDHYVVTDGHNGTISIRGSSISALSTGLRRYLTDIAHVDIYWFIGSRLDQAPAVLPCVTEPIHGSSTVPWRYHFNTVTFSYTTAFWTWADWETQLDWLALHGVNLPLAWVGQEKILVDVFRDLGLTNAEIATFLSGPAFQAWNRFGNIQGSWGGDLPQTWLDRQFALQMKILPRMAELGMTPVLPAFAGFVPMNITRVLPNARVVRGSQWAGFSAQYSNDSYLEPFDEHFARLQSSFIGKQRAAYGNISHIYTLDQYNENLPYSGELDYLRNVTYNTWQSLKQADPDAVWMMQGWLFYAQASFWTEDRIQAFLSGVPKNDDMLILDLFSESAPQWRRTKSYHGKPWIWCQVHDYGGNMGLYGQLRNVTVNATQARMESPSLVGYGLTMEGQEGNEIIYTTLLDQAWSATPLDTKQYFHRWVQSRYTDRGSLPKELYESWELLRTSVYDNTNTSVTSVIKSAFEIRPSLNNVRIGFQATSLTYDPAHVIQSWQKLYRAAELEPQLWINPAYQHDMVDLTRQVMANAFIPLYHAFISTWNTSSPRHDPDTLSRESSQMMNLLSDLDAVLLTNRNFRLSTWINSARSWAHGDKEQEEFFEYNARNQITLWGPNGEIADYASKQWGGLISNFYIPRWRIFCQYLQSVSPTSYNATELDRRLTDFEQRWQTKIWNSDGKFENLQVVIHRLRKRWPTLFCGR